MNVIGKPSPPPGYHLKEDPPLQRFIKEVNRIWIAPALAGIPAFLVDNWWKNTRRAGRNRVSIQEETKGVGAALQGLRDNTLPLSSGEVFTTRIAGSILLLLLLAFLIYAWLEQRKRNDEVVLDASRHNIDRDRVVALIPKRKYLIDRARAASEYAQLQNLTEPEPTTPTPLTGFYQYPPKSTAYRPRR